MNDKEFNFLVEQGEPGRCGSQTVDAVSFDLITNHKERPADSKLIGGFISVWDNDEYSTLVDIAVTRTKTRVVDPDDRPYTKVFHTLSFGLVNGAEMLNFVIPYFDPNNWEEQVERICNTVEAFASDLTETVRSGIAAIFNVGE